MKQSVNRITVDSRRNCYVLPDGIEPVENTAATAEIEPGVHVIRINKGSFSYFDTGEEQQPSVLLWIAGGKFKNKASEVAVGASWGCLNGYNDTYTIEVIETTKLLRCSLTRTTRIIWVKLSSQFCRIYPGNVIGMM